MRVRTEEDRSWRGHFDDAKTLMLEHLGVDVLADAQHYVAVQTGSLRDSLEAEVQDGVLRVGSRDVDYSIDQELGTADSPPHPYLQPSMYQHRTLR